MVSGYPSPSGLCCLRVQPCMKCLQIFVFLNPLWHSPPSLSSQTNFLKENSTGKIINNLLTIIKVFVYIGFKKLISTHCQPLYSAKIARQIQDSRVGILIREPISDFIKLNVINKLNICASTNQIVHFKIHLWPS